MKQLLLNIAVIIVIVLILYTFAVNTPILDHLMEAIANVHGITLPND